MKKNRKLSLSIIALILFMSIGFAFLTSTLGINGTYNVSKNRWKIYFDNIKVLHGQEYEVIAPTTDSNKTQLDYEVKFRKPDDYYEFTVDVVNAGTIDAMINLITNTTLTEAQEKLIDYTVTYVDGTPFAKNNYLQKSSFQTYKVKILYSRDINTEDLPSSDMEIALTLDLEYIQADETHDNKESTKLAADLSDKDHNGTIHGGVFNNDGTITLDGVDDYVDCGYANYDFNNSVTYIARVKVLSFKENHNAIIGNWESAGGGLNFTNQRFYMYYYIDEYKALSSSDKPELNKWYTIVGTYNGSESSLYINGIKITPTSDSNNIYAGKIKTSPAQITLGTNIGTGGALNSEYANIQIDYALLYDRAITEAEIADYTDKANPSNKDSLLFWYDFD